MKTILFLMIMTSSASYAEAVATTDQNTRNADAEIKMAQYIPPTSQLPPNHCTAEDELSNLPHRVYLVGCGGTVEGSREKLWQGSLCQCTFSDGTVVRGKAIFK